MLHLHHGQSKRRSHQEKDSSVLLAPCRESSKENCGRGQLIEPADLLRYPGGSSSQRDLTLVLKRTEIFCIQKRDKVFHWEISIRALTVFATWAKCKKKSGDWSQQKIFHELLWEQDKAAFLSAFFFLLLLSIGSPWRPAKSASCAPHFSAYT